ncbi:hypothetical protein G6021_15460 [Dietzia sp. CW19]|uniref:hypothetical protein n=1 Tax=Dietzia sp. CW19 TaxID=1630634 RepID=UPI0015F89A7E|nr:hypothetical protein [Dietzia sp. CW19]MBB1052464.1 hypothetical protein [Dietzia sp. CW19]
MTIDPSTLPPTHGPGDPRGVLCFREPLPEPLQVAEDSTAAADHDRVHALGVRFQRPATLTERRLLEALGWTDAEGNPPGPETMTSVRWLSVGVRRREWPTLYPPIPTTEPTTPSESEPTP